MARRETSPATREEALDARQRRLFVAAGGLLALMMAAVLAWFLWDTLSLLTVTGVNPVLFGFRWAPDHGHFGLMPFIWGSVTVGILALLGAVPLGVALAVVIHRRLWGAARVVSAGLTAMVAIPSVIFGWWGLEVVVPAVRTVFGGPGFSLLAASVTLAVMIIPTLAVLAGEAIRAVPATLEDASRALGATEDETLWHITLTAAGPGIMRAVVLAAGRALAETMAVQMVIGSQARATVHLNWPGSTLTTGILTNMSLYPPGTPGGQALTVMAFLLMAGTWFLARELRHWEPGP